MRLEKVEKYFGINLPDGFPRSLKKGYIEDDWYVFDQKLTCSLSEVDPWSPLRFLPLMRSDRGERGGLYFPRSAAEPFFCSKSVAGEFASLGSDFERLFSDVTSLDLYDGGATIVPEESLIWNFENTGQGNERTELLKPAKFSSIIEDRLGVGDGRCLVDPVFQPFQALFSAALPKGPELYCFQQSLDLLSVEKWMQLAEFYSAEGCHVDALDALENARTVTMSYPHYGVPEGYPPRDDIATMKELIQKMKPLTVSSDLLDRRLLEHFFKNGQSWFDA